ncbi:MAG TPA: hypothetical protein VK842_03880, partial [bacterium]|nr:hypothetical protein [bacterium]
GWPALLAGALVWASPNALLQSVGCMEWPWVVLAAVLYWRVASRGGSGWTDGLSLFMVGLFGSLARTDSGLLPAAWFLVVAGARLRGRAAQPLWPLAWGLVGAVAGIGVALANNVAYTGTAMQLSALVKQYWAAHGDRAFSHPFTVLFSLFPGGLTGVGKLLAGLPLVALLAACLRARGAVLRRWLFGGQPLSPSGAALVASAITLPAYLLIYAASAEVNLWYSANMVVPVLLLGSALFSLTRRRRTVLLGAAWIYLAANTVLLALPRTVPYPTQTADLAVGRQLVPAPGEVWGAWDCGVASYYSDCGLINLDGLMNNDIYPLMRKGHVSFYPTQRGITRLLGGGLDNPAWKRQRGLATPCYGAQLGTRDADGFGVAWAVRSPWRPSTSTFQTRGRPAAPATPGP